MPTELLTGLVSRMNSKLPFLSGEYGVFLKETVWRISAWVLSVYIYSVVRELSFLFRLSRAKVGAINDDRGVFSILQCKKTYSLVGTV